MADYKAFVSSTYLDLKDHRVHVIDALRKAGFFVDPMEEWTSESDEPKVFSKKRVEDCDLCILLVAFRRGHVPDGETESITQMEHRRALECGIEVRPFLLEEEAPWPRGFDEMDKDPAMRPWREWLAEHHSPGRFGLGSHTIEVAPALTRWMKGRKDAEGPTVNYWMGRPASLARRFVGRGDEMKQAENALDSQRAAVISGGPGTGKSRLAAEYTYALGGNGFWTEAGNNVSETLAALAPSFDIATGTRSADGIATDVERALAQQRPETLWTIDSLTDLDLVNELLGRAGPVRLLVTTRDARRQLLPGTVGFIQLESLDQEAAVALLISKSKYRVSKVLRAIADVVGCLPLALEMLAVRLGEPRQTPEKILGEFERAPTVVEVKAFEEAAGATIPRADGVYGAIVGSLSVLEAETRDMIAPLGYLADAPIPEALVMAITDTDAEALDRLLKECSRQSVLTVRDGEVVAHALTAAAIAATNESGVLKMAVERARGRLTQINTDDPVACRAELAHYERLRKSIAGLKETDEPASLQFASDLAIGLSTLGQHQEAVALFEETLAMCERTLGPEHANTLAIRNNIAGGYWALGRSEEALALTEETLAMRERTLGPEDPATLASRSNLAIAYRAVGRTEEAVRLDEETVSAFERVLGTEHANTLSGRSNLAEGYRRLRRNGEAATMDEETLAVRERVLGPEHPDTVHSRHNLAMSYTGLGRYQEALVLDEETLAVRERLLGPEHPDTLHSRNNLGAALGELGKHEEAVELHEETLAARERVLGPEHPESLRSRRNLAAGYRALGRDAEADALEGKPKKKRPRKAAAKKKPNRNAKPAPKTRSRKKPAARRKPPSKEKKPSSLGTARGRRGNHRRGPPERCGRLRQCLRASRSETPGACDRRPCRAALLTCRRARSAPGRSPWAVHPTDPPDPKSS